jgi:phage tail-like protein
VWRIDERRVEPRTAMPATQRNDPYKNFNFVVEIDGISVAAFCEVSGLVSETEVIQYRAGNDFNTVRKLPGLTKYANIVLKRGITQDNQLWDWRKAIEQGRVERRDGSIVLLDDERQPVRRWHFSQGWITKYDGPDLNAKGNDVAIETIEIAHEGLTIDD